MTSPKPAHPAPVEALDAFPGGLMELALTLSARDGLSEEAQKEAAHLFDLLADVAHHPDRERLQMTAEVGLRALCARPPNIGLAEGSRKFIGKRIHYYRRPVRSMSREAPATWLLIGLVALILMAGLIVGIAVEVFGVNLNGKVLGLSADEVILVFISGAVGAGVSVLQRLEKLDEVKTNSVMLFCTGLTKPLVGAASAIFLYVLITSHILAIDLKQYDPTAFFASVGFLAGFSERLLPDVAKRAVGTLTVAATDPAADGAATPEDAAEAVVVKGLTDPAAAKSVERAQEQQEASETQPKSKSKTKSQVKPRTGSQVKPRTRSQGKPGTGSQVKPRTRSQVKPGTRSKPKTNGRFVTKSESAAAEELSTERRR